MSPFLQMLLLLQVRLFGPLFLLLLIVLVLLLAGRAQVVLQVAQAAAVASASGFDKQDSIQVWQVQG